jgi:hypothetical protein
MRATVCGGVAALNDAAHLRLSTGGRQPGILVCVRSVSPRFAKVGNFSFLGPGGMDNLLRHHV